MKIMKCVLCEKEIEVLNNGVDYVVCGECIKRLEQETKSE
jgi:predicted RNA-binding Zn-ribbon protein involved in translation (DUF1610 family)